ncbi:hypothetical protein Nepgr_029221 [Nepenthes gracilis]|uniref:Uncharacterized protein n=1 Tax=Nepenthes gracilis TaxID=150966 RepID=A0AAD3TC41_NEPGR|nr:hypothetical protein Nepgr_029221 [Nepenthes gracilis]
MEFAPGPFANAAVGTPREDQPVEPAVEEAIVANEGEVAVIVDEFVGVAQEAIVDVVDVELDVEPVDVLEVVDALAMGPSTIVVLEPIAVSGSPEGADVGPLSCARA